MTPFQLLQNLYEKLSAALTDLPVFIDIDGSNMRYAESETDTVVSSALRDTGTAVVIRTRSATRLPSDDAKLANLRTITVPIEIKTQKIRDVQTLCVNEIIDKVEHAITQIGADQTRWRWSIGNSAVYTDTPADGFVQATHQYTA